MKSARSRRVKAPTGIAGFDEMTGGGLPCGRTALLVRLVKLAPAPARRKIVGTLSQTQPVLQALGPATPAE